MKCSSGSQTFIVRSPFANEKIHRLPSDTTIIWRSWIQILMMLQPSAEPRREKLGCAHRERGRGGIFSLLVNYSNISQSRASVNSCMRRWVDSPSYAAWGKTVVKWCNRNASALSSADRTFEGWHLWPWVQEANLAVFSFLLVNRGSLWGHACGRGQIALSSICVMLFCDAALDEVKKNEVGFTCLEEACVNLHPP